MEDQLRILVETQNLSGLESFCLRVGKHRKVLEIAERAGIDMEELEELLARI